MTDAKIEEVLVALEFNDGIYQREAVDMAIVLKEEITPHLIDDSPEKLDDFNKQSVAGGKSICMKQTWNTECHTRYKSIDRLSDIIDKI